MLIKVNRPARLAKMIMVQMLMLLLLLTAAGCGGTKSANTEGQGTKTEDQTVKTEAQQPLVREITNLPQKVTIGIINSKALPPQVVYGFQKGVYKGAFPAVEFMMILSKGHCDVAENMEKSAWDFMYLGTGPAIEFVNYGYDKWKPAQYTILAGAQSGTSTLMVKSDLSSTQQLDGKTVGITNKNNDKEMLLNKMLAKAGLKTAALGGTVKVRYDDPVKLYNAYQKGEIQGFFPMPSMVSALKKTGSKVLSDGTETEFGKDQSFSVFAVSNKFLKQYPEFTKEMVRLHVSNTEKAQANLDELVNLTYTLENSYFKNDPQLILPKPEIRSIYTRLKTTYDPSLKYLQDSHQLLQDAKYVKAMPEFSRWADFTLLNEVLAEK
ncbi:MAG TPA: ABC transporter substrate-binding protein [Bacillota bacterium]|nr:ABC transporter substrate-binding protein [Bacillota bacterium]